MEWLQKKINLLKRYWEEWYQGKYKPPPPNDPYSSIIRINPGRYEKYVLAKWIESFLMFWHHHWKWIIGPLVTILLTMIFKSLFQPS